MFFFFFFFFFFSLSPVVRAEVYPRHLFTKHSQKFGGAKRLVSVNICSVEGNSAGIFVSKVSPGIFVIKIK